jgi:uncharacterized protein YjeT (DUF2065 family)
MEKKMEKGTGYFFLAVRLYPNEWSRDKSAGKALFPMASSDRSLRKSGLLYMLINYVILWVLFAEDKIVLATDRREHCNLI